jgi:hypothetical protein
MVFILFYNILKRLMQNALKLTLFNLLFIAKWSNSYWSVFENCENPVGAPLVSC